MKQVHTSAAARHAKQAARARAERAQDRAELEQERAAAAAATERRDCLRCGARFDSTGPAHRLCANCSERATASVCGSTIAPRDSII
jgi:hypothetical protein